jgi:predicted nuclease of predicted toxin-antitoxin system
MKIRLYLDEDVDVALASALRQRGIDVLTTQEAGKRQQTDEAQLEYAVQAGRVFFTHNRGDFARLHGQRVKEGRSHAGVIVSDQLPLGILLRRLSRLCFSLTQEEMIGRLEFLGGWR